MLELFKNRRGGGNVTNGKEYETWMDRRDFGK